MDEKDHRLLTLLRENARLPVSTLADAVGVSRGTVQNRIDRMIERGEILGFTVRIRPDAVPSQVRAVMMVEVEGERTDRILKLLRGYPEVSEIHTTNGRWDLVLELRTDSLAAFDQALRRIRQIKGIAASETSLLLSSFAV
jgi:DNA-binding Lrp family transcriptional regulator